MRAAQYDEENKRWVQNIPFAKYYSAQDVAEILWVGSASVYSAINRGTLKAVRINDVVHVRHEALLDYIARRRTVPTALPGELIIEDIIPVTPRHSARRGTRSAVPTTAQELIDFLGQTTNVEANDLEVAAAALKDLGVEAATDNSQAKSDAAAKAALEDEVASEVEVDANEWAEATPA